MSHNKPQDCDGTVVFGVCFHTLGRVSWLDFRQITPPRGCRLVLRPGLVCQIGTRNRTKNATGVGSGMRDRERTDDGTFRETVTLDDVLAVFDDVRGPVVTSSDVSDALDCSTEAARQKLATLSDRGKVDKRKTGRTVVYWHTGGGRATPDEQDATEGTLDAAVSKLDATEDRRDAVRACIAYLREHETAQKRDFTDAVYPEHAFTDTPHWWWNELSRDYLRTVAEDLPALSPPQLTDDPPIWRWEDGADT